MFISAVFIFFALSASLSLLLLRRQLRLRRLKHTVKIPSDLQLWQELATGLISGTEGALTREERMTLILSSGLRRLRLSCGIVTLNDTDSCRVIATESAKNSVPDWLCAGRDVSLALTFCGLLNEKRENLAIEYAGISNWRLHAAHRDLGWEAFVGTRRELASGKYLTVSFFDWVPRDQIFSAEERGFVNQLANWIAVIYETGELEPAAAAYAEFPGADVSASASVAAN